MPKKECKKNAKNKTASAAGQTTAYRLKCAKTANGLSHFVMYGDAPEKKTLL